jgi:hypothetical protein
MEKIIRSRSNKNIGDVLEDKWEIVSRTVIAEPTPGDRYAGTPPRLGIYEYGVKPLLQYVPAKTASAKAKSKEPSVGGTRREASSVLTVRRTS